jgi:oxygen-independent coproporphyrinogen-3 oxidase
LTHDKLRAYRDAGVNRLSIGLQAWQDRILKSIGRIHTRRQFVDNVEAAAKCGFENINVDLIFGLPGQTLEDWMETLEAVTGYEPVRHISCYSLKIEPGTVFGDKLDAGLLEPVDEELDRRMYQLAVDMLADRGRRWYEISNFAMPGYECRHNLLYWKAREYAGFGAGAHSYLDSVRFNNVAGIEQYIRAAGSVSRADGRTGEREESCEAAARSRSECGAGAGKPNTFPDMGGLHENIMVISREEAMSEFMILGLRLTEGVSSKEFEGRFGERLEDIYGDRLEKLVAGGLLEAERVCPDIGGNGYNTQTQGLSGEYRCSTRAEGLSGKYRCGRDTTYKLTRLGFDLANTVFVEFI